MSTYQIDAPTGAIYDESGPIESWRAQGHKAGSRVWQALQPVVRLFVRAVAESRARQAIRDLHRLDDRMLRDIGIERATIDHAVRHGRELDATPLARVWATWGATGPFPR